MAKVDGGLAAAVAWGIGVHIPKNKGQMNFGVPADGDVERYQPIKVKSSIDRSEALSMANTKKDSIRTRKIAILAADGVTAASVNSMKAALMAEGAAAEIIAPRLGVLSADDDTEILVDKTFFNTASVFYDAVYVPGGISSVATLEAEPDAVHFLNEAYKHCKPIAADADAMQVLEATYFSRKIAQDDGLIVEEDANQLAQLFIGAIAQHRFWDREKPRKVPA